MKTLNYVEITQNWIERLVIGLKLCPFAKAPFYDNKILYTIQEEKDIVPIFNSLVDVAKDIINEKTVSSAFLILPNDDHDFLNFYQKTKDLEEILATQIPGIKLVAFHPGFYYEGTDIESTVNATNRSPFPMIHLLRSAELNSIRNSEIDVVEITSTNEAKLKNLTWDEIEKFLR